MKEIKLGVNIDHVATLRNARGTSYPAPVFAAAMCEESGADSITIHLREDRRHIVDNDVVIINQTIKSRLNLEIAATDEMINFASEVKPHNVCLVPENREEITTEGGLDVKGNFDIIKQSVLTLHDSGIIVSLFVDADEEQINCAKECGADCIEIHTGPYSEADSESDVEAEFNKIFNAAKYAYELGLKVHAGHGLHYHNVTKICSIPYISELNIGHSIIANAVFNGLKDAVKNMKCLMLNSRN